MTKKLLILIYSVLFIFLIIFIFNIVKGLNTIDKYEITSEKIISNFYDNRNKFKKAVEELDFEIYITYDYEKEKFIARENFKNEIIINENNDYKENISLMRKYRIKEIVNYDYATEFTFNINFGNSDNIVFIKDYNEYLKQNKIIDIKYLYDDWYYVTEGE